MRVDNVSDSSQIYDMHRPPTSTMKGIAMLTLPYRTLVHYKRWATNGLNGVIAENLECLPADEQVLIRRLLDHIQAVDEIFRHNLQAQPHGYAAPRSPDLPSVTELTAAARAAFAFAIMNEGAAGGGGRTPATWMLSNAQVS